MSDTAKMGRTREGPADRQPLVDDELADQVLGRAQAEGAELLGPESSDGEREVVECRAQPVVARDFGGDVAVTAAQILHEAVTGGEDPH